jgi:hypothetical protein
MSFKELQILRVGLRSLKYWNKLLKYFLHWDKDNFNGKYTIFLMIFLKFSIIIQTYTKHNIKHKHSQVLCEE